MPPFFVSPMPQLFDSALRGSIVCDSIPNATIDNEL